MNMKALVTSLILCLSMQPIIAMENDHQARLQEKKCDFYVNTTLTLGMATILNAKMAYDEYQQHGCSQKCMKLATGLGLMTAITCTSAILTSNSCN